MNRRTIAAGIGWAVVLSLAGCGGKPDSAKTAMPVGSAALAVELSQVTQAPLVRSVTVSGAVAAWQDMQLGVELSGLRIADVKVEVGDEVKRGDVLVTLDARTLDSELKMAEAAAQEAQAGILLAAMPVMGIYPILAQRHGMEGDAAATLLLSTLASFISLNLLIATLHAGWL